MFGALELFDAELCFTLPNQQFSVSYIFERKGTVSLLKMKNCNHDDTFWALECNAH